MLSLLIFVLQVFVVLQSSDGEIFYVTPTSVSIPDSVCPPDQLCHTLQHYVDNTGNQNVAIDYTNLVIVFLSGSHTVTCSTTPTCSMFLDFNATNLTMYGVNSAAVVHLSEVQFIFSGYEQLHIENFTIHQGSIGFRGRGKVHISSVSIKGHLLNLSYCDRSSYREVCIKNLTASSSQRIITNIRRYVRFMNCYFVNSSSPLIVNHSHVTIINSTFDQNRRSALVSTFSTIKLVGVVLFVKNSGIMGGAIALHSSPLEVLHGANVIFVNNSAQVVGGAIFIEPDLMRSFISRLKFTDQSLSKPNCFYQITYSKCRTVNFYFDGNNAAFGGNDVYGSSWNGTCNVQEDNCLSSVKTKWHNISNSSVSSDPTRVCLCNSNSQPECKNSAFILINRSIHLGEVFTISAVVVGGDYGVTIGNIYANFLLINSGSPSNVIITPNKRYYTQATNDMTCTELSYKLPSTNAQDNNNIMMYLTSERTHSHDEVQHLLAHYKTACEHSTNASCYLTPVFINVSILPCPPGFTLLGEPPECGCYPVLTENEVECTIFNGVNSF